MNCQEQNVMFFKNIKTASKNFRLRQQDSDAKGGRREPSPHLMCFYEEFGQDPEPEISPTRTLDFALAH